MDEVRHRRLIALASLITLMAQPCYVFSRDRASHILDRHLGNSSPSVPRVPFLQRFSPAKSTPLWAWHNLVGFARSTKYSVLPSRYELVLCKKCTCTPLTRCVSLLTQVRTLNLRLRLAAQEGRLSQP
ncbi:hypothetical protein EDC04DRAFT_2668221 [Pisolithus marmoratus]|nr:hypothetical protein EDC04DRAFT_2668221 [Pisolithus marmoratus]